VPPKPSITPRVQASASSKVFKIQHFPDEEPALKRGEVANPMPDVYEIEELTADLTLEGIFHKRRAVLIRKKPGYL